MKSTLSSINVINLKRILLPEGDVLQGLKKSEKNFSKFGEVYFSHIYMNKIKAWKYHKKMNLNLIVPIGEVAFVFCDSKNLNKFRVEIIGENRYSRIYVPKAIWFGFKGLKKNNLIMNISSIEHDQNEIDKKTLDEITFDWEKL